MFTSVYLFLSSSDESECDERVERKRLRDASDPLSLPEEMFLQRFKLSKEAFKYVLEALNIPYRNTLAVQPVLQLAFTLSLLGSGSYQQEIGNDCLFPVAQSTMSKCTSIVLKRMESILCYQHIQLDTENTFKKCKEFFAKEHGIPGVIGCVDSTHVSLCRPARGEHMYLNKNNIHSLNVMIICDHKKRINALNCRFGGRKTDAFVWQNSDEREYLEEQFILNETANHDCWLLGDAAYPLEPWCLTPYLNPSSGSEEERFNKIHSKAHSVADKTIRLLKNRWKILLGQHEKKSRYDPEKMSRFVNVCAALHNICIKFKIPFVSASEATEEQIKEIAQDLNTRNDYLEVAKAIRDQVKLNLK